MGVLAEDRYKCQRSADDWVVRDVVWWVEVIIWLPIVILMLSAGEYVSHRWLMHKRWDFGPLKTIWYRHMSLHHGKYYKRFDYETDPVGKYINLRLTLWHSIVLAAPFCILISLVSQVGAYVLACGTLLHLILWNVLHSEMHNPQWRFFRTWRLYRWLAGYHWVHHKHPAWNFNVIFPFWDFVLRTHRNASREELVTMRSQTR